MAENKISSTASRTPPPAATAQQQAGQPGAQRPQTSGSAQPALGREITARDVNRMPGLGSGINTDQTIAALIAIERRREDPIKEEKQHKQVELEAFKLVKQEVERMQEAAKTLASTSIWEGKLVESSNENAVKATATAGAKPGKYTMIVDKLALNHQITSQGYDSQDAQVGLGKFKITVGEGNPITVTVDHTNNTLSGLKDAINSATKDVQASVIKTGAKERPYQLVLTSQKTGSVGRIKPEVDLKGGLAPVFVNSVEEPSPWAGAPEAEKAAAAEGAGGKGGEKGASDAIVRIVGQYSGNDDHTFTLNVVQSGEIGGDKQVQIRWKDETGRSGLIELDKLNYAPGTPVPLVDGLSAVFSKGSVVVGDTFNFNTRAQRSDLAWWLSADDRKSGYSQPSAWERQSAYGAPQVEGPYTGKDEANFSLTVQGSGQVGSAKDLKVLWKSSTGETGALNIGDGYEIGGKLALTDGITVSVPGGVLTAGQKATFHVTPQDRSGKWWLSDKERIIPAELTDVTNWSTTGQKKKKNGIETGGMPELPPDTSGPRSSTTRVSVGGKYTGDESKIYTFTAKSDGTVGTTRDLKVHWEDEKGAKGDLTIGENYALGSPLPFDSGLVVGFGPGRVFKGDTFTVHTRTATIQPPQDAVVRFGATELGGGLEITSPTNDMENVIEGVKLTLVAPDPKPVTITIKGDTQKAADSIVAFMNEVNQFEAMIGELTKYDKENNYVGPLQGNREVVDLQNQITNLVVDPVPGLPKSTNMLFGLGVKLNDKGVFVVDEDKLRQGVEKDFAAVGDLFRERGDSSNQNVAFVGMTDSTRISADGYPVDIRQVATEAYYQSPDLHDPIMIDSKNNRFALNVDGKQSDEIVLEPKAYSLSDYARTLQNKITNDKQVGDRGVRVSVEGSHLRVQSGRFGKDSNIAFVTQGDRTVAGVGLLEGQMNRGQDVAGTINGLDAEGNGQLLKGKDGSPMAGLRLLVKLNAQQLNPTGPEATIKITRGVASRTGQYLTGELDPFKGDVKRVTDNLRGQVTNLDAQLSRMEERVEAKRQSLQEKFARLETQMAKLKSQQNYMSGQLASVGGGGGGKSNLVSQLLG